MEPQISYAEALALHYRLKAEGRIDDKKYIALNLARINNLAERTLHSVIETDLHAPLLQIMAFAQEEIKRLRNG